MSEGEDAQGRGSGYRQPGAEGRLERWMRRARKALRRPPWVIAARAGREVRVAVERYSARGRAARFDREALLRATAASSLERLWERLASRPYPAVTSGLEERQYAELCAGDKDRIVEAAEAAVSHRVDLLGSGQVDLGRRIDWLRDYKTGWDWPPLFFRDIDYNNPERPSDVKFPWELSRMQWLIPAGQAFLLTGDERYARAVRDIIDDWIDANPYAYGVNWACTMEVAIRVLTWSWLFHVFGTTEAWGDRRFRERFLRVLYLHGEFTAGHLERSDINGNHYTADAVGLVFAGLFFGEGRVPTAWHRQGWSILEAELPRQVHEDGVDFELSTAYHRLVAELFLAAALYRQCAGEMVPRYYAERLTAMAYFTQAYTAPDGHAPLWGDADDARALPFGDQDVNDHRYLCGLVGLAFEVEDLKTTLGGSRSEAAWWFGDTRAGELSDAQGQQASGAFPEGGVYVLRSEGNHVFVDCGPVGLAGRGGHGHNDCLAFECWINGEKLITDCGAYVYTASYSERNWFRSTFAHNTPVVDGEEINRLLSERDLWTLRYDAIPQVREWRAGYQYDRFVGTHSGYHRLPKPVTPVRGIVLDKKWSAVGIIDRFEGTGIHSVELRWHLVPGVSVKKTGHNSCLLITERKSYVVDGWDSDDWSFDVSGTRVSYSYGKASEANMLIWRLKTDALAVWRARVTPSGTEESSRQIFDILERI